MRYSLHAGKRSLHAILLSGLLLLGSGCVEREVEHAGGARDSLAGGSIYGTDPVENGRISYLSYCASCHGPEGKGDGPVAASLTTPPTDLTQFSLRSGGFDVDSVYAYIDGREDVRAHGTREMPVWGNIWIEENGMPVRQEVVDRRINELVEYLRTIQIADTTATS